MKKYVIIASVLALGFNILATSTSMATPDKPKKPKKTTSGVTASNLDRTVKPTADFYQYACGGWMANNPLGDEYARYGSLTCWARTTRSNCKTW